MNLLDQDRKYILPIYKRLPLEIVKAEGMILTDQEGKEYLDFYSGIAVHTLGHRNEKVLEAMRVQMESFLHLSNYFASPSAVTLAKLLVENSFASKVFFANSGAEANEAMLKLARKYGRSIRKDKVNFVALEKGFHGRTYGAMNLTGTPAYREPFGEALEGITHVRINDVDGLRSAVDQNTCGIFFEVIQGEGGLREMEESFAEELMKLSEEFDVLLLADEVQTGLFRTGTLFAHEILPLTPHAMTLAKGLGGGLPLGALLLSEKVEHVLRPGDHGSTFGGNPLACAAGAAVLEEILEKEFQEKLKVKMDLFLEKLKALQTRYPEVIKEIRGRGYMVGLDVGEASEIIREEAMKRQLLLNITGGTVLRLLPALTMGKKEMDRFFLVMEEILSIWRKTDGSE